jgi:hypothetical protein
MKLANRFIVAMSAILALVAGELRADTLNMPIFPPITFSDQVDMRYTIENTVVGVLGKFSATGRTVSVTGGGSPPLPGGANSFTLTAFFNPATGVIIMDHANSAIDPTLDLRDGSNAQMYFSRRINRFAYDLSVSQPTFDFEFFNQGGTMPAINPKEFIGATLRNSSTFSGTKSFVSAAGVGTVVFNNNQVLGLEVGTANVFMTPTPSAVGGGGMLLACLAFGAQMRRCRSREIE